MGDVLQARDLEIRHGTWKLSVPLLSVRRGEVLAVLGPNGAGKTSLLMVLAGLRQPAAGTVLFDGVPLGGGRHLLEQRRRMALVLQDGCLLQGTVLHNVVLPLRLRGVPWREARERARRWLDRVGALHLEQRAAGGLSRGEVQRVILARALVSEPELLLLDEPFSGLDRPIRQELLRSLRALLELTGITCIFVTHDFAEVPMLADRVVCLLDGRVADEGSPWRVLRRPRNPALAQFLGIENVWPVVRWERTNHRAGRVWLEGMKQALKVQGELPRWPTHACLPADEVELSPDPGRDRVASANWLPGRVTGVYPAGEGFCVEVSCGIRVLGRVGRRAVANGSCREGAEVWVHLPADALVLVGDTEGSGGARTRAP